MFMGGCKPNVPLLCSCDGLLELIGAMGVEILSLWPWASSLWLSLWLLEAPMGIPASEEAPRCCAQAV